VANTPDCFNQGVLPTSVLRSRWMVNSRFRILLYSAPILDAASPISMFHDPELLFFNATMSLGQQHGENGESCQMIIVLNQWDQH
jgi:hypothetical protein